MKNRITIGISSIVLIFLILCLAVFSLLSLSDAKTALSFSERHADAVHVYYMVDAQGQTFIRDYRKALAADPANNGPILTQDQVRKAAETAAKPLPDGYAVSVSEDNTVRCDIPLENGQKLRVDLNASGEEILSYYIFNDQEYIIDTRMPVFGADLAAPAE